MKALWKHSQIAVRCGLLASVVVVAALVASQSLAAQGVATEGRETPRERMERLRRDQVQVTVGEERDETPAERIERLRRELRAAEAAAEKVQQAKAAETPEPEIPAGALVVVSSETAEGSGFIARMKGRIFFVTNIHVLGAARGAQFRTVDGEPVPLASFAYLSRDRDIAIVPIEWEGPTLEISNSLSFDEVDIGQPVTVMGNSSGARVATRLEGKVEALGPDEIEVSAKFEPGNSGSPIIHNELGTVIAVASHMRDLSLKDKWTQDSELADIRRFGYRLDGEIEWQQIVLDKLFTQGETFERFKERTFVMAHISQTLQYESKLLTGYREHESLGYLFDSIEDNFDWSRGTASSHNQRLLKRLIDGLMGELQSDRYETDQNLTVDFYRKRFRAIDSARDTVTSGLRRFSSIRL